MRLPCSSRSPRTLSGSPPPPRTSIPIRPAVSARAPRLRRGGVALDLVQHPAEGRGGWPRPPGPCQSAPRGCRSAGTSGARARDKPPGLAGGWRVLGPWFSGLRSSPNLTHWPLPAVSQAESWSGSIRSRRCFRSMARLEPPSSVSRVSIPGSQTTKADSGCSRFHDTGPTNDAGLTHENLGPLDSPAGAGQHAQPGAGAVRRHRLHPARRARVPRRGRAHRVGHHRAARGQPPGRRVGGHRHPGGGAQHGRGSPDPDQLQRGRLQQHHPRVQSRARCRGGGPGHPRQGGPDPGAAARRRRRAGGGQAGRRCPALLLAGPVRRELRPASALRHRRPAGQEPAADACPG